MLKSEVLVFFLSCVASVHPYSAGGDATSYPVTCDTLLPSYGDEEQDEKSGKIMWWVKPPTHSTDYTLRTGDGDPAKDPTTFTPGQWLDVHIRTLVQDRQYSGLLLYAVDGTENKVGEWEFPQSSEFWLPENPGCDGKSVLHSTASKFAYHEQFRFRPPANITSDLTFRCLLKYGLAFPSLGGSFYWPNERDLSLTNSLLIDDDVSWLAGMEGRSCTQTCSQAGAACRQDLLQESAPENIDQVAFDLPVFSPPLVGCSVAHPYLVKDTWVAFPESAGAGCVAQASCGAASPGKQRICPCGGAPLSLSASQRTAPRLASLPAGLALLAFFGSGFFRRPGSTSSVLAFCLGFAALPLLATSCSAHNWINNPSRTGKLSMRHPCPSRTIGASAHLQVGRGQRFPVEWATGHNGMSWFAVVNAEDEDKLVLHNEKVFREYIAQAPASAGYMAEEKKYRVYSGKSQYTVGPLLYPVGTFAGAEIERPDVFPFRFGSTTNRAIYEFEDDAKHHSSTVRASYESAAFPWILAVHGFKITHKNPKESDIANIEVPAWAPSGRYVVHWMWAGYRDCIDVEVLEQQVPATEMWGTRAGRRWHRTEHCQYRREFMRKDKFGTDCFLVRRNETAASALASASRDRFMGVNVIPWRKPDGVPASLAQRPPPLGTNAGSGACPFWSDRQLSDDGKGGWTGFLSVTATSTRRPDDDERRPTLLERELLPCFSPTAIECRRKNDSMTWAAWAERTEGSYCDKERGLFVKAGGDWEVRYQCDVFDDLDAKVAYGFQITPSQLDVGDHKDVSLDPEDPVFYSTCYTSLPNWEFSRECPACSPALPELPYIFGDRCVSCAAAKQPLDLSRDATWQVHEQCKECEGTAD